MVHCTDCRKRNKTRRFASHDQ